MAGSWSGRRLDGTGDVANAAVDGLAQATDGGVVAQGLLVENGAAVLLIGVELDEGGVGLGGATPRFKPDDFEVGHGGPGLVLSDAVGKLQLTQQGHDLGDQPALLGVDAQEQADVGVGGDVGRGHSRCWYRCCAEGFGGPVGLL